jgi:cyclin-dependent kinase-like
MCRTTSSCCCRCALPSGPLCRQHDILFLKNSRFAGLKFPDMSHPMTLEAKFYSVLPPDALDFLK